MTGLVLVVDDVPANVKLLEAKLTNEYYDVVTAKDGYEAIEQTKARMPDLILLDVMMPGMDGFETCRQLKQNPDVAHIPVVMVTALSDPSDRVQGLEAGADDFITKPINDTALFARVRSLVRIKVLIDELRLRDQSGAQLGTITDKFSLDMDVSGSKVMVIDDDVIQSRRMNEKLGAGGYSVEVFSDHNKALEYGKSATGIDVIIISTQLADIDGLRLGTQFKAIEAMRNVPIIMLVDEDEQHLMLKALDLGVNDYLITPIDFNEMFARVKTQVRRKQYQEALKSNYQESMSMAVTDALTKLYNRHYLDTHMKNMVEQAQQSARPMSLVIMDMDHFKTVNDTYGHDVGDEILIALADIIVNTIRSADLAARFGGEEFVVLMPETDEARAFEAAERIRKNVESFDFKVNHEVGVLNKTVSIGCATMQEGDTPESLLKRADTCLYEAKHGGRNRVRPVPADGEGYEPPPSRQPDYQPEVMEDIQAEAPAAPVPEVAAPPAPAFDAAVETPSEESPSQPEAATEAAPTLSDQMAEHVPPEPTGFAYGYALPTEGGAEEPAQVTAEPDSPSDAAPLGFPPVVEEEAAVEPEQVAEDPSVPEAIKIDVAPNPEPISPEPEAPVAAEAPSMTGAIKIDVAPSIEPEIEEEPDAEETVPAPAPESIVVDEAEAPAIELLPEAEPAEELAEMEAPETPVMDEEEPAEEDDAYDDNAFIAPQAVPATATPMLEDVATETVAVAPEITNAPAAIEPEPTPVNAVPSVPDMTPIEEPALPKEAEVAVAERAPEAMPEPAPVQAVPEPVEEPAAVQAPAEPVAVTLPESAPEPIIEETPQAAAPIASEPEPAPVAEAVPEPEKKRPAIKVINLKKPSEG